jgi:hypothetical protein
MNQLTKELFHHGIRNQRWGVRNGPPYPLDKKTSRRVKSGKQDKEIRRLNKKKKGVTHVSGGSKYWRDVEDFEGIQREFRKDGSGWTRTYGDEGLKNIAEIIGRGGDDERAWRTLDRPGHKATSEDLLKVNQQRFYQGKYSHKDGWLDPGLHNNCGMCSVAMFLRGQGYDVQAGRTDSGVLNSAEEYWFDGAKSYKAKGAQAVYQQLQSFGNQGKGVLSVRHKNGGGHAVYFQMEKQADGKLRPAIYDGQIAKKYDSLSEFLRAENADLSQFTQITRLDGSTPNWKHLAEDGVLRANVGQIRDPGSYWRHSQGSSGGGAVERKKDKQAWATSNFAYTGSKTFQREYAKEIEQAKNGTWWTDNETGDIWRRTDAWIESEERAFQDKKARQYLKQKYGIGG